MIPVVVIPAISRFDALETNLRAFDEPVGRLVIIDNSLTGYEFARSEPFVQVLHIRPVLPLGATGGWNAGISQTPDADWWLLSSTDIGYGPGDLARIAELMESAGDAPAVVTGGRSDHRMLRGAYLAINRACVDVVGLYDEWSFFPCYYEDDDYMRRCELAGVAWLEHDGGITHDRSITIRSSEAMAARNAVTQGLNSERYAEKWGGPPAGETFDTPWNAGLPLWATKPDLAGRARRQW